MDACFTVAIDLCFPIFVLFDGGRTQVSCLTARVPIPSQCPYPVRQTRQLPMIYCIENNQYGMGTSKERSSSNSTYYTMGNHIPGLKLDGMNVLMIREVSLGRDETTWALFFLEKQGICHATTFWGREVPAHTTKACSRCGSMSRAREPGDPC